MRSKTEKKLISLSRPTLINGCLKDVSKVKCITESAVAEEILLEALLPKDKEICNIISSRLYTESDMDSNLPLAIKEVFDYNAVKNKYDLFKLAEYARDAIKLSPKAITAMPDTAIAFSQACDGIDSMIFMMENYPNKVDLKESEKYYLEKEIAMIKSSYKLFKDSNGKLESREITDMITNILNNWCVMRENYNLTYHLLGNLVYLSGIENNDKNRVRFLEITKAL